MNKPAIEEPLNVFGEALAECSQQPLTGFFRDGSCNTHPQDVGNHTVCVQVTAAFLLHSKENGNDLLTPAPQFGFPGLKHGDRWCLCAQRWLQAERAGMAPKVYLRRTHRRALDVIPLEILRRYAADLN